MSKGRNDLLRFCTSDADKPIGISCPHCGLFIAVSVKTMIICAPFECACGRTVTPTPEDMDRESKIRMAQIIRSRSK